MTSDEKLVVVIGEESIALLVAPKFFRITEEMLNNYNEYVDAQDEVCLVEGQWLIENHGLRKATHTEVYAVEWEFERFSEYA